MGNLCDRMGFSDAGNLYDFLRNYRENKVHDYSYLSGKWADHEQWRVMAKAKVFELMGYFPDEAPLDAETVSVTSATAIRSMRCASTRQGTCAWPERC